MNRKIIEYEILCSQELGDLENIINDKLKDGYELYGYPSHLQEDDCRPRDTKNMATTHYQAMVKYEDPIDSIFEGAV